MSNKIEVKHTPTPWRVGAMAGYNDAKYKTNIVTANGTHIASTEANIHLSDEEKQANAEHIVKCVNSHAELVEALKFMADKCNDPALAAVADAALLKAERG